MTDPLSEVIEELRRLETTASPPGWTIGPAPYWPIHLADGMPLAGTWFGSDARLIHAMRNALPRLLAVAEASEGLAKASDKVGAWVSAALEDRTTCAEFRTDIETFLKALAHYAAAQEKP